MGECSFEQSCDVSFNGHKIMGWSDAEVICLNGLEIKEVREDEAGNVLVSLHKDGFLITMRFRPNSPSAEFYRKQTANIETK